MFNDSYHPGADKDSGRFKDCAVMRGAQWIGMHANCHQKYVASLTIFWHGSAPWRSTCQKGSGKTKINEQR